MNMSDGFYGLVRVNLEYVPDGNLRPVEILNSEYQRCFDSLIKRLFSGV